MKPYLFLTLLCACAVESFGEEEETEADIVEEASTDALREALVFPKPVGFDVTATPGTPPIWVHFTNPDAANGRDLNILSEVVRLIDNTEDGGTIRAAIHSLSVPEIAEALKRATRAPRNVDVRIVEDEKDKFHDNPLGRDLAAFFGDKHEWCGDGREGGNQGCITSDQSGIMHTKLFTFSATRDPNGLARRDVVWVGSANMTLATGARSFNNTVTVYGDGELYQKSNEYFQDLKAERHAANNDYFSLDLGRGYIDSPSMRMFASPQAQGDLVEGRMKEIVAGTDCEVRVAQAFMFESRMNLVDQLVRLKRGKCNVIVVANPNKLHDAVKDRIRGAGIELHLAKTHDKYILVDARYNGSTQRRKLVFTGSHNWTSSANRRNDELFVRVDGAPVYAKFLDHFNAAKASAP